MAGSSIFARRLAPPAALLFLAVAVALFGLSCAQPADTTPTAGPPGSGSATTAPSGVPMTGPPLSGTPYYPEEGHLGAGPGSVRGRVTTAGGHDPGTVLVGLLDASGEAVIQVYARPDFLFDGLPPGEYRMATYTMNSGYISQWYGGLPVQTHPVSDSQILTVGSGETRADFVLEPGRAISGRVTWSGAPRSGGWVWAFDEDGREVPGHGSGFYGESSPTYVIIGLVPGRYKVGATDDANQGPRGWYGGGRSADEAAVVDVTETDGTGIDIDMGRLPPTTALVSPQTTVP